MRDAERLVDEVMALVASNSTSLLNETVELKVLKCIAWRQTGHCTPNGVREPSFDLTCDECVNEIQ
jgi:hypothetical protein